jgi:rhodanese-related sulfurtransferase
MKNYFFVILSFCIWSCNAQTKDNLNADEFEKGIAKDSIQILDVRTVGEFNSGHIKNALWADWNNDSEFERRTSFIDKKKPVYVYCLAGGRSASAANMLRKKGFEKVYELAGGINAWNAKNKILEGKTSEKQMAITAYDSAIVAKKTVLVDFGATWCPPCKKMEPIIASVLKKYGTEITLLKVDGGKDEDLLKKYKVTTLPVFIIYKDGKEVWRRDGVATEAELEAALK